MNINLTFLILTIIAALWSVMGRSLLKATIGLAATSALISILIFRLDSPLAAVFELSVCTGLITAVFVSTISLTKPLTHKEILQASKDRFKRYWYLPVILVVIGIALVLLKVSSRMSGMCCGILGGSTSWARLSSCSLVRWES
jgi:NADH-quinone oxidoreductase subunit J